MPIEFILILSEENEKGKIGRKLKIIKYLIFKRQIL